MGDPREVRRGLETEVTVTWSSGGVLNAVCNVLRSDPVRCFVLCLIWKSGPLTSQPTFFHSTLLPSLTD